MSALVSSAIRNQGMVVQQRRLTVSILIPVAQAAAFAAPAPLSLPYWDSWSIGGVEIDVGNVWLDVPDAQLVARTRVEQNGVEMEKLEFVGDLYSYRFERWTKPIP
jgi:hypothetical protein